ncbi:uncharacterized protein LOC141853088 [Brevipalpus obovatus]|uniref:uncharacterized protein LOC141853088 n=1 Tax=Brevipalpus obovatus TaxID=246614 RepID=UPI003D9DBEF7
MAKLNREDMNLFGICPAYDPFYLVVCEQCGQVIKPQALAKHIDQRHQQKVECPVIRPVVVKKPIVRSKLLPCKDREYDPNKHCGVRTGDMDKPCTRSLTCKTHSLTLRRSVIGRLKNFDELLAEHRATKEAALRAAGIEVKPTKQQLKQRELEAKRQLMIMQQQIPPPRRPDKTLFSPPAPISISLSSSINYSNNSSNTTNNNNNVERPPNNKRVFKQFIEPKPPQSSSTSNSHPLTDVDTDTGSNTTNSTNSTNSTSSIEEKPPLIEVDGSLYLPYYPKPIALCTFNARQIPLTSINCDQDGSQYNLSSRLFSRQQDLTYSALNIFRDKSRPPYHNLLSNHSLLIIKTTNMN